VAEAIENGTLYQFVERKIKNIAWIIGHLMRVIA